MNIEQAYKIHNQFQTYFDGYTLIGSSSLWMPFYKKEIEVEYAYLTNLTVLEEFVGKCVDCGIIKIIDIRKVLGIQEDFFISVTAPLIQDGFMTIIGERGDSGVIEFTPSGKELYASKVRHEQKKTNIEIFYDGVNECDKVEFLAKNSKVFFHRKDIVNGTDNNIVVNGRHFPAISQEEAEKQRISKYLSQAIKERLNADFEDLEEEKIEFIRSFKMLAERELFFKEYCFLIFKNSESSIEVLVVDLHSGAIESKFQQPIINLLNEKYFDSFFDLTQEIESSNVTKSVHIGIEEEFSKEKYDDLESVSGIMDEPLDVAAQGTDSSIQEVVKPTPVIKYIMNYEIRELFLKYLDEAQKSLLIISPWMNRYVINRDFMKKIQTLLERGVKIQIICGITSGDASKMDTRDNKTVEIANELREIGKNYGGLLSVDTNAETHEKLLICDEKYYINGSYNFLSYAAEDNKFFRNEGSTYTEDKEFIKSAVKRFNF